MTKPELLAELQKRGVQLNEYGRILFAHDGFTTSATSSIVETVEISVADLGYADGATLTQTYQRAIELGLSLCPLELGPHLRLQFLDQPEGYWGFPPSQHRTPPGAVIVASLPLSEDENVPKGFYLRRIQGVLWLRGYQCSQDHLASPEEHYVFGRSQGGQA